MPCPPETKAQLYRSSLIPLKVILASLTWAICDYFVTLEDEVRYIWNQKWCLGKFLFLFIRYYTLLLLLLNAIQIHVFAIPGVPTVQRCVALDPAIRLLGAISLWTIEIIMQFRIYALFNCSRKIAIFNGVLFLMSIVAFIIIMAYGAASRAVLISPLMSCSLRGCPVVNGGTRWTLWVPATVFEFILFGLVLYKGFWSFALNLKAPFYKRRNLVDVLIGDNILYFLGITLFLIFNNLMVGGTMIPWLSYGPFQAGMGIMTTRMLLHVQKISLATQCKDVSGVDASGLSSSININGPSTILYTDIERSTGMCERPHTLEENRTHGARRET